MGGTDSKIYKLYTLLKKEKSALMQGNIHALPEIAKEKESLIKELHKLGLGDYEDLVSLKDMLN